jgi:hypothetical protein
MAKGVTSRVAAVQLAGIQEDYSIQPQAIYPKVTEGS